jgi:hypothetical protein
MRMQSIKTPVLAAILGAGVLVAATAADAAVLVTPFGSDTGIVKVAQGCGPGRWRGPGGYCRGPGYGPVPGRHCWRNYYGHWRCN